MAEARKIQTGELESLPPIKVYEVVLTMTESEARLLAEAGKALEGPSVSSTIAELARAVESPDVDLYDDSWFDNIAW